MAELSENKVKALIRLVEREKISIEDIKDKDYQAEVENKIKEE